MSQDAPLTESKQNSAQDVSDNGSNVDDHSMRGRWISLAAIVLLVVAAIGLVKALSPDGLEAFLMWFITVPAAVLAVLGWWTLLSGLRWRTRGIGLVAFGIAAASFWMAFRVEGFEGDMRPRLQPRWMPTREERAATFWKTQPDATADQQPAIRSLEVTADDWPEFRGPDRDGIVRSTEVSRDWTANPPKLVWKHPVGPGWSSFAVVDRYAFTQEQRDADEVVVCYDTETGRQIWAHADQARFEETLGGPGPRATPTVYDGRVYALGATGILNCLDALSGERIWSRNILDDAVAEKNLAWAMAGSPLVVDGRVIVNPGGGKGRGVISYNHSNGEIQWSSGNRPASYTAPRLQVIHGEPQVFVFGGDGLAAHDPKTGEELWFHAWENGPQVNAAIPIVRNEQTVLISCGYSVGSMLFDVIRDGDAWSTRDRWSEPNRSLKLKFNDGVYRDGYVYGLDDGILACIEFESGERQWKRGRYGYGQLLLLDDVLVILSESGDLVLVQATPDEFRELAKIDAINGKTWNHPALAGGKLFVRNADEAACFDLSP